MALDPHFKTLIEEATIPGVEVAIEALKNNGVDDFVGAGFLDEDDLAEVASGDLAVLAALREIRSRSAPLKDGWSKLVNLVGPKKEAVIPPPCVAAVVPSSSSSSARTLRSSTLSFVRRNLFGGLPPSGHKRLRSRGAASSMDKREHDMAAALKKVHGVFMKFAFMAPRLVSIRNGHEDLLSMQLETYRMGSRSAAVVAQRARLAESFFLDVSSYGWVANRLTPFQTATWVRSRMIGGLKTAASSASQTLRLVFAATSWKMNLKHPLVQGQLKSKGGTGQVAEPPVSALTPPASMVINMEELISSAPTVQLRCLAGFFVLLALGSGRAGDIAATRRLLLTKDALSGQSVMKNKKFVWTQWFCARRGLVSDWAALWMLELKKEGLPGADFVLWACNGSCDQWLDRPASYPDLRRGLHFLLHNCCGFSIEEAIEYNPHSFRHFLVESGQQLRTLKVCSEEDLERLGHWAKGSSMPQSYDNAAGVSELQARYTIIGALQSGWRPAGQGELPQHPSSFSVPELVPVGHIARKMRHLVKPCAAVTVCGMWQCGSRDLPGKDALYGDVPSDFKPCKVCVRGNVGDRPQ